MRVDGPEGRHAVTVRRLAPGEPVELVDGAGRRAVGTVTAVAPPDRLRVEVTCVVDEPPPSPRLVVVQALAKGERGELAVELLTEVGVDVVVPWASRRSVAVWRGDRADRGLRRWRTTAVEASKQARRARIPEITPPADTAGVVPLLAGAALPLVLHESAVEPLPREPLPAAGDVVVVVGPEGGIDDDELAAFTAAGARPVRLGPTVLRTSTAGVVALGALLAGSPRWSAAR